MTKKKNITVIVIFSFLVVGAVCYFFCTTGPGMILPFKKVSNFSREVSFVSVFGRNKVLLINVSNNYGLWYREISESNQLGQKTLSKDNDYYGATVTARPDGTRLYICRKDELAEFDATGTLLRRISIEEFKLGPGSRFGEIVEAVNDRLWLSVGEKIIEWQPDKHPSTRLLGPEAFTFSKWAVDPIENRVFLEGNNSGIFDFDTEQFIEKDWQNKGSFFDFAQDKDLLLSGTLASGKDDIILKVNTSNDSEVDITWGAQAQWGYDGYIYFLRGSTALLRCKPDGSKIETVYSARRITSGGNEGTGTELKFSHDRTVLAFHYRVPRYWGRDNLDLFSVAEHFGIVLIDLKAKEFIDLTEDDFCRIYLDMYSKGLVSLDATAMIYLEHERVFWYIENMALLITNDVNTNSVPTSGSVEVK